MPGVFSTTLPPDLRPSLSASMADGAIRGALIGGCFGGYQLLSPTRADEILMQHRWYPIEGSRVRLGHRLLLPAVLFASTMAAFNGAAHAMESAQGKPHLIGTWVAGLAAGATLGGQLRTPMATTNYALGLSAVAAVLHFLTE